MSGTTVTRTRSIDNGEPLVLRDPPDADGGAGYAVVTEICTNPHCPCSTMRLTIRRTRPLDDGSLEVHGPGVDGQVSSNGTGLTIDDAAGMLTTESVAWIRERLEREDHRLWFRERWSRVRGQAGDPAYPSGVRPEGVDAMIFFSEVFPYDFDLTVADDGCLYLADDQYCLQPACTCDEFVVQFVDLSTQQPRAVPIGHARASVRRLQAPNVHGPSRVQRLWRELLDGYGVDRLRQRFQRIRRVAREGGGAASHVHPQNVVVAATKVGRNATCPCGSGKKFKRCCGA
jgi:hypothetical protein